jgi:hypothetical protein
LSGVTKMINVIETVFARRERAKARMVSKRVSKSVNVFRSAS